MKVADYEACKNEGDWFLTPPDAGGQRRLSFLCPCGCGTLAGVRVNQDGTQANGAWEWNMDEETPTCKPSININNGHWHGYLTDGVFKAC